MKDPIIVVGMHRSGTSIVARLLTELGVHMGHGKDVNHEPMAYMMLNNWILLQAGTTWQYPNSIDRLLDNSLALESVVESISAASKRGVMKSVHATHYFKPDSHWGWKDPRNSITLPIWLSVYPNARIIYVKRTGIPVASSMVVRRQHFEKSKVRYWHRICAPAKPGPAMGSRIWQMDDVMNMWDEYCCRVEDVINSPTCDSLSISYEDLILTPDKTVQSIADYLGGDLSASLVGEASNLVKNGDPYAYRLKPDLKDLESKYKDLLSKHGYGIDS